MIFFRNSLLAATISCAPIFDYRPTRSCARTCYIFSLSLIRVSVVLAPDLIEFVRYAERTSG